MLFLPPFQELDKPWLLQAAAVWQELLIKIAFWNNMRVSKYV